MNMNKKKWLVLGCFGLVVSMSGCDVVNSIKEYFSKSENISDTSSAKNQDSSKISIPLNNKENEVRKKDLARGDVLARVGDWSITTEEFNERLTALKEVVPEYDVSTIESKKLVLEELIRQQLLVSDAESRGVTKQKDVLAAIEEFKRTLIVREVAAKIIENISVTDTEAKEFYEENKENIVEPAQWHVREIVLNLQLKANQVLMDILKGMDFAEMAKQRSIGKTAAKGGDLGFITEEPFPQMATALLSMKVGDVSSVFKGPEGFYIVKLEEKIEGKKIAFDEIKEEIIKNRTLLKQQQAILDYIEQLKENINIEINEELLK